MLDIITEALKALDIEGYQIEAVHGESLECFFVKKNLDLKRATSTDDYTVTVFKAFEKDGRKLLGSSQAYLHPGMGGEEVSASLKNAAYAASLAGNDYYELYKGEKAEHIPSKSGFAKMTPQENMNEIVDALFYEDRYEDAFINSAEIFVRRNTKRIITSAGADVSFDTCDVWGEYVIQCLSPEDVETYHQFNFTEPDSAALRAEIRESIEMTRARANAGSAPPTGTYPVIISGKNLGNLFRYYLFRSDASSVYQKYSSFKPGDNIQGDDVKGDRITLVLKAKEPYSSEGIPMKDRVLMEDGVLKTLCGTTRFSRYLGIEPTGSYRAIDVPIGDTPASELRSGKYLEAVTFSGLSINPMTGYFGGEIRLGFLSDGETVVPVTGGSISGNFMELQKQMTFSKERFVSADYTGPACVKIEGVSVAGK